MRVAAEGLAELDLRGLEAGTVAGGELPAGAIDVEVQHAHRGLELGPLRAPAPEHGGAEPTRDARRIAREEPGRQVHRVRRLLDATDPRLRAWLAHRFRARAAVFAARERRPRVRARVRAAFFAASCRDDGLRRRAAPRAILDIARVEVVERDSRPSARLAERERRGDVRCRPRRPFVDSRCAFSRVSSDVVPRRGGGTFTPERRAFDSPIATACFAERAP